MKTLNLIMCMESQSIPNVVEKVEVEDGFGLPKESKVMLGGSPNVYGLAQSPEGNKYILTGEGIKQIGVTA